MTGGNSRLTCFGGPFYLPNSAAIGLQIPTAQPQALGRFTCYVIFLLKASNSMFLFYTFKQQSCFLFHMEDVGKAGLGQKTFL